ncbi:ROK family protein [Aquihabitans sp. G128]|uniref:ROK family protein n=1 Tax=Aquihabitans sp. G128 TaxID=2849779 RepID=UPI001C22C7A1|nr:ROK family protein [Aquihabitans sp. G128]QXC62304.1 ROK family protein [Aquihabitans sp. G128]
MSDLGTGLVCGLDLGGTKLLGLVADPAADSPVVMDKVPTAHGADAVVDSLVALAQDLIGRVDGPVVALGLGAPGLVDRTGTLRYGPNIPGVIDLPFAEVLGGRLGIPVVVDNDATCAAWAEHEKGAARGANHSVTVTLGTGIGAGITVKGEVLRGAHGYAGEPGHMVVDPSGPLCPCGRRGCWERYASGSGLGWLAREAAVAGVARRVVELAGGDPESVRGEHVTAAAAEGDDEALAVVRRFAWWVALGVANLVNILDSEIVVIGGGLAEAGDLLLDPIRAAYAELVMGADHREPVPIVQAALGERAGAWGAALLASART